MCFSNLKAHCQPWCIAHHKHKSCEFRVTRNYWWSWKAFPKIWYWVKRLRLSIQKKLSSVRTYDRRKLSLVWTACSMHSKQYYCQPHYCSKSPSPEPFAMNLSKTVSLNDSSKRCLPSSHEFSQCIFCWIAFFAFTTLDYHYRLSSGAPNDNFQKTICSEDDLRSRIFRTFVVKFLACLLLLVFSNI